MRQNIVIFGATGKVGRELVGQIAKNDVPELEKHENPTVVIGLADSKDVVIREGGFPRDLLLRFADTRLKVRDLLNDSKRKSPEEKSDVWNEALEKTARLGFDGDTVFVDVTAEKEAARDFHLNVIRSGGRIVTANKNPISRFDPDIYEELTQDPTQYGYSATTMAGLGAVPWISERVAIGDSIEEMTASLSGTVGFITDQLTQGIELSKAIEEAKKRGYTEPDFRDDLSGLDVARKLVILAREAGHRVDIQDIAIEPFLPKEYFDIKSPEECLRTIKEKLDAEMAQRYERAKKWKQTFKYLAAFQAQNGIKPNLKIGLSQVRLDSAFGRLGGTDNRIKMVTGKYSKDRPFKLERPGAGLDITASVVRRDLLRMQPQISRLPLS